MFEELLKKDNTLIYSTRFGTFCNEIVTQGTGLTRPTATSKFFCNQLDKICTNKNINWGTAIYKGF